MYRSARVGEQTPAGCHLISKHTLQDVHAHTCRGACSVPGSYMVHNSSSEGSDALFWPPRVLHAHGAHTHMQANIKTVISKRTFQFAGWQVWETVNGVPFALMLNSSRQHLNPNNCFSHPAPVPCGGNLRKLRGAHYKLCTFRGLSKWTRNKRWKRFFLGENILFMPLDSGTVSQGRKRDKCWCGLRFSPALQRL